MALATEEKEGERLILRKHCKLISKSLELLPGDYSIFDTTKPTVFYFLLSSLDLLGRLEVVLDAHKRREFIDWVYLLQVSGSQSDYSFQKCGFRGSAPFDNRLCPYESPHIAQTYTALCVLLILGDDFSRLDADSILKGVGVCQGTDGSFFGTGDHDSENDMRFLFCACAICYILDDFSHIDIPSLLNFVRRSVNYDGGIAVGPGLESHGGSTFCAIAALALTSNLWDESVLSRNDIERLKEWAVRKQDKGFHGRTNKPDDSCYAFWVGATLTILNSQPLVDWLALRAFLLRTQDTVIGGFSKHEDSSHSDILHSYFSLSALGMFGEPLICPLFAPLNISKRAHEHLQRILHERRKEAKKTNDKVICS